MKDKIEKANNCEMTQKYIAKGLTHFTKTYETLCDILADQMLIGGSNGKPDRRGGIAFVSMYKEDISRNAMIKVNKVCFSDIPEGQMDIHKNFDSLIVEHFNDEEKRKNIKDFRSLLKYTSSLIINSLTIRCKMETNTIITLNGNGLL